MLVSTSIASPTQDIFIFPDMYLDEKLNEEEEKEPRVETNKLAIQEEEHEGDEEEEEKQLEIMGKNVAPLSVEKIVILSKTDITVFDLTSSSLNSHSISIEDSDIKSEVI